MLMNSRGEPESQREVVVIVETVREPLLLTVVASFETCRTGPVSRRPHVTRHFRSRQLFSNFSLSESYEWRRSQLTPPRLHRT